MSSLSDEDRANLTAYLDGELDEETSQALEARISLDPEMRKEYEEMKKAWTMLDYLPQVQPSATFTNRTLEKLSLEGLTRAAQTGKMSARGAPWRRALGWTAAVVLAGAVGFGGAYLIWGQREPADQDEPLVRHLRILEKWRQLENIEDLEFLKALDHPDLFGEEQGL